MKIFSWIRSKRNGNEGSNTSNPQPKSYHQTSKEEFSDWPNGLLAIGTFGNNNLKQSSDEADNANAQELEEVGRELRLLLNSKRITVEQLLECLRDCGDSQLKRKIRGISKNSLSFLIKKALLCGRGFDDPPPLPILRDPLKPDLSRMEKILRAMLHKKVYPQTQKPTPKKYLDMGESESEEEEDSHRNKWVKTDSEYIVLEI